MGKEEKLKQKKELEEKHKIRDKQILQIKASNELLQETLEWFKDKYGDNEDETQDKNIGYIENAIEDNITLLEDTLNSNEHEMASLKYNKVKNSEVKKYNERLKKLGKTDEEIRTKDLRKIKGLNGEKVMAEVSKKEKTTLQSLKDKLKQLTGSNKSENNEENITKIVEEVTNQTENKSIEKVNVVENNVPQQLEEIVATNGFDPREIPSYVQYDMLPLPSKGECYPHKKSHIPVAYLTAADENLITSRNMYENGSMIDIILERKILDKSIRVSDLCKGDRDAIAIWLRATAYGNEYPVVAPYNGEDIEFTINLSDIEYLDFELKGDENGYFTHKTDGGDELKYKVLSYQEEINLLKKNIKVNEVINRNTVVENLNQSVKIIENFNHKDKNEIIESIDMIKNWVLNFELDANDIQKQVVSSYLTDKMISYTMSVNGITDRDYIKTYIENMRAQDAIVYRRCVEDSNPGVNLDITVPIPESLGGGSFNTFLSIGETIFINV